MHNLLNKGTCFLVVHGPDLLDTIVIGPFEPFKSLLKVNVLIRVQLILLCVILVPVFGFLHLDIEAIACFLTLSGICAQFRLHTLLLPREHRLSLLKHDVIEVEFRLIQLVNGFHVLHTFLENLHLGFKLDLLLSLFVGILTHGALEIIGVIVLLLLPLVQILLLDVAMVFEQLFDLDLVALEDVTALAIELRLNVVQLGGVALAHGDELVLHLGDECVDVLGHLRDRLDVVAVLLVNLSIELRNQQFFVADDLGTGRFLRLNVLFST